MKYTVLYVDDEAENLWVFKSVFRREYHILTALSGEECLQLLDTNICHLIITDQRMPVMTGVELLKRVYKNVYAIAPGRMMLSGFSQTEDIEEAIVNCLFHSFVSKPWNTTDLKQEIDKTIRHALSAIQ